MKYKSETQRFEDELLIGRCDYYRLQDFIAYWTRWLDYHCKGTAELIKPL